MVYRMPERPPAPGPDTIPAVVESLRLIPGWEVFDPASPEEIRAAEVHVGMQFPAHYRALLTATNGLGVLHGASHEHPDGPPEVPDVTVPGTDHVVTAVHLPLTPYE